MRDIRGNEIAMIFQEPMTALNPQFYHRRSAGRGLITHRDMTRAEARARALPLCARCIPEPERRLETISA